MTGAKAMKAIKQTRAILFVDMVGYSRRIGEDEIGTLEFMSKCFDTLRLLARRHDGQLVKTMGDGALILFEEAVRAADFGVRFHEVVAQIQPGAPDPMQFRIGIHLGQVLLRDGDAFGHAVNISARLMAFARPGKTVVSQPVHSNLQSSPGHSFTALGTPQLKNIRERAPVYRLGADNRPLQEEGKSVSGRVRILGTLLFAAEDISLSFGGKLANALLGYLVLCPGQCETIDRLCSLLWPGQVPAKAHQALRRCVARINSQVPGEIAPLLTGDPHQLSLAPGWATTDLSVASEDARAGRVAETLRSASDWDSLILSGTDGLNPTYDNWLAVVREAWRRRLLHDLETLLEADQAGSGAGFEAANVVLRHEPGNEVAARGRIRYYLATGNRAAAIEEYYRLAGYLSDHYGILPGDNTTRLHMAARETGGGPVSARATATPKRRLLRIAVSPFANDGTESGHRVAAFRGDLIANLAKFRDWSIIEVQKGNPGTGTGEGQPDYLITCAQATDPQEMLITLKSGDGERVLWREHVVLKSDDWAVNQQVLIRKIAASIEVYVSTDRLARTIAVPTSHDEWLAGDRAFMHWTPQGATDAARIFRAIIADDPDHAPSHASLASMSNVQHIIWPGCPRDAQDSHEADQLASRAVELDPLDARNQRVVAWAAAMNGAYARALLHLDLAMNLNPSSPVALGSCAMGYAWFGEGDKADVLITQLQQITGNLPDWLWSYLASVHFLRGRQDEALAATEMAGTAIIDNQGWLAAIHARRGDTRAAGRAFRRLMGAVTPIWTGATPASPETVRDWLCHAYPIRNDADRSQFSAALDTAMRAA